MTKTTNNYTKLGLAISAAEFKGMVLTKLEYIEKSIDANQLNIKRLARANQNRKRWQDTMDTRLKVVVTLATLFGGIIVFVVDKVIDLWSNK